MPELSRQRIICLDLTVATLSEAAEQVIAWARNGESRTVCAANVHMMMEAHDDPSFGASVNSADMVTPDGMPIVWALRLLGQPQATRVYGPDLTLEVCRLASERGVPVGFYGARPDVLQTLTTRMNQKFPALTIAYALSPPFRPLQAAEQARILHEIQASGARVLFIGLGCPRQERWMAEYRSQIPAVLLGVGAAFDFHSGSVRQAPKWMQQGGLEWLFRLAMEPRRLWKRYFKHNPRFLALVGTQVAIRLADKIRNRFSGESGPGL